MLDGGTLAVSVWKRLEADGVLAALACVALATEPVHGDGNGLMCFGTDRTKTHRARAKSFYNLRGRFHSVNADRWPRDSLFEFEQTSQCITHLCIVVDVIREPFVSVLVASPSGDLDVRDGRRIPTMTFALGSPMEFAEIGEHRQRIRLGRWITECMAPKCFFGQYVKTATLDSAVGAGKATCDHFVFQTQGFENLSALVASKRANTHFRHDLEHAFGDRFAIPQHNLAVIQSFQ